MALVNCISLLIFTNFSSLAKNAIGFFLNKQEVEENEGDILFCSYVPFRRLFKAEIKLLISCAYVSFKVNDFIMFS